MCVQIHLYWGMGEWTATDALALARDLDPVRQRAQGPVRPAAAPVIVRHVVSE